MKKEKYLVVAALAILLSLIFLGLFILAKFEKSPEKPLPPTPDNPRADESEVVPEENLKQPIDIPVDFETLWETNTDVYAWIKVPGTNIDYPIVQNEDNTYYLNHTWDKKEYKAGSIFTETYNSKTFDDPNTVLYGHRMYAGDMFAQLQNCFSQADFFDENRVFYIYTPEKILTYEIVAAFPFGEEHLLFEYNFSDESDFERFENDVFSILDFRACFLDDVDLVCGKDKLVTLSTCLKGNGSMRYLVLGRLINTEE